MKRVTEDILQRAGEREVAIYGCNFNGKFMLELFTHSGVDIKFFIDRDYLLYNSVYGRRVFPKTILDPKKHFIIIASINPKVISSMRTDLADMGFVKNDYFSFPDDADRDLDFWGITVGRRSSFVTQFVFPYSEFTYPFVERRIENIGRFTHINRNANLISNVHASLSVCSDFYDIIPSLRSVGVNRVIIGNDVWISAGALINASKVNSIGNGAVICALAVVVGDVPPYAIMAGAPAKVIKYRFSPEQIEVLQRVQWWNWDNETILENEQCFHDINLFFRKFR